MCDNDKLKILEEAIRHTEIRLEDFLKLGLAADQRAMTFASLSMAIAAILASSAGGTTSPFIIYAGSISIVLGSALSMWSAKPKTFEVRGHRYEDWEDHITNSDTYEDVLKSQAKENDDRLKDNLQSLKESGQIFTFSLVWTVLSTLMTMTLLLGFSAVENIN
ncbi:MAG: hypothetical protein JKX71_08685 [Amylibacter sp.]|nr:hypothetical protein [Amylibacter sp.]